MCSRHGSRAVDRGVALECALGPGVRETGLGGAWRGAEGMVKGVVLGLD